MRIAHLALGTAAVLLVLAGVALLYEVGQSTSQAAVGATDPMPGPGLGWAWGLGIAAFVLGLPSLLVLWRHGRISRR